MSAPDWTEPACTECGDRFVDGVNEAGRCGGCQNEHDGLCYCGGNPEPGSAMCGPCSADLAADEKFHAMHEEAL